MSEIKLEYIVPEDVHEYFKIFSDTEITSTLIFPEGYPPETSEGLATLWEKEGYFNTNDVDSMDDILFSIKQNEVTVGYLYLSYIDRKESSAELEITLCASKHCGKGLGAKAIYKAKDFAFSELGLKKLYLHVLESNTRAIRCYEKCGFVIDDTATRSEAGVIKMCLPERK